MLSVPAPPPLDGAGLAAARQQPIRAHPDGHLYLCPPYALAKHPSVSVVVVEQVNQVASSPEGAREGKGAQGRSQVASLAELSGRIHGECQQVKARAVRWRVASEASSASADSFNSVLAAMYKGRGASATRSPPFIDRDSCLASSGRSLSSRRKRKRKRQESHHRSRPG
jgi:hypothetical protein